MKLRITAHYALLASMVVLGIRAYQVLDEVSALNQDTTYGQAIFSMKLEEKEFSDRMKSYASLGSFTFTNEPYVEPPKTNYVIILGLSSVTAQENKRDATIRLPYSNPNLWDYLPFFVCTNLLEGESK